MLNNEMVLVEFYTTYGKGDNPKLSDYRLIANNREERAELLEEYAYYDCYDDKEAFISGDQDTLYFTRDGVDWDESNGAHIVVSTKKEALHEAKLDYAKNVNRISTLFGSSIVFGIDDDYSSATFGDIVEGGQGKLV